VIAVLFHAVAPLAGRRALMLSALVQITFAASANIAVVYERD
jgi:hypothetical protein